MTWAENFVDLLTVCGAAPSRAQRGAAARLLATEMISRLNLTNREHNPPLKLTSADGSEDLAPVPLHFAYRDYLSADTLGGERRANQYMWWGTGRGHHVPGAGTVPKEPRPQAEYDLTLVAIVLEAEPLIAEVIAEMGAGPFDTAKEPYLTFLETHFPATYPPDS